MSKSPALILMTPGRTSTSSRRAGRGGSARAAPTRTDSASLLVGTAHPRHSNDRSLSAFAIDDLEPDTDDARRRAVAREAPQELANGVPAHLVTRHPDRREARIEL